MGPFLIIERLIAARYHTQAQQFYEPEGPPISVLAHLEPLDGARRDRRGAPRFQLSLGSVLGPCGSEVMIRNLSSTGLVFEASVDLLTGDAIEVQLPEMGPTIATIMWTELPVFGCRFEHPIPSAAVSAALLRSNPPTGAEDGPEAATKALGPARALLAHGESDTSWRDIRKGPHRTGAVVTAALALAGLAYVALTAGIITLLVIAGVVILLLCLLVAWGFWVLDHTPNLKL